MPDPTFVSEVCALYEMPNEDTLADPTDEFSERILASLRASWSQLEVIRGIHGWNSL